VFQFHGTPGSRLELFAPEELFRERRIHLVTIDRPGYGLSDYVPISLLDWPARVAAVADAIEVDKFALIGISAGTPFALAVAAATSRAGDQRRNRRRDGTARERAGLEPIRTAEPAGA